MQKLFSSQRETNSKESEKKTRKQKKQKQIMNMEFLKFRVSYSQYVGWPIIAHLNPNVWLW